MIEFLLFEEVWDGDALISQKIFLQGSHLIKFVNLVDENVRIFVDLARFLRHVV